MNDLSAKLLLALVGAVLGWGLKASAELISARRQSNRALWLLEGELQTIRAQVSFVGDFLNEAKVLALRGNKKANESLEIAQQLAKSLPLIMTYSSRFDQIASALTPGELEIAKERVAYYNVMRLAFPDRVPDISGLATLERIAATRRHLRRTLFWALSPRRYLRARRDAAQLIEEKSPALAPPVSPSTE